MRHSILSLILSLFTAGNNAESAIRPDEVVVFFPACGYFDESRDTWIIPVHGWIYEPETDSIKRAAALGLLRRAIGLDEHEAGTAIFKERARLFLVDNKRGKKIHIRLGSQIFLSDESEPNGHFRATLKIPVADARALLKGKSEGIGALTFEALARQGDDRRFTGSAQLIDSEGISVVSDIDDTIKITDVLNKKALLANTFLRDFQPVKGMAERYSAWAKAGASFHYVSASPWQLYSPLSNFMSREGFPDGAFHMKFFRTKDSSFFDLFARPDEFKPPIIESLLGTWPRRQFILVGDAGEKDPEIYGDIARRYPGRIAAIYIRLPGDTPADDGRFRKAFEGVPEGRWKIFRDPAVMTMPPGR